LFYSSKGHYRHSENLLEELYTPVETAIARLDDVLQLLVALGAEVSTGTKGSLDRYSVKERRISILDWVRCAIQRLCGQILGAEKAEERIVTSGWKRHHGDLLRRIEVQREKEQRKSNAPDKTDITNNLKEIKSYLVDAERVLVSRRAKTWQEIISNKPEEAGTTPTTSHLNLAVSSEPTRYFLFTSTYGSQHAPQHTISLYDELYEACFAGSNERIQQLCLPPEGTKMKTAALQISVRFSKGTAVYSDTGIDLITAISRQH
jgi:hypothetical protein